MGLEAWRCPNCRRMLAKVRLAPGSAVEVKCKCGLLTLLDARLPYVPRDTVVAVSPGVSIATTTTM